MVELRAKSKIRPEFGHFSRVFGIGTAWCKNRWFLNLIAIGCSRMIAHPEYGLAQRSLCRKIRLIRPDQRFLAMNNRVDKFLAMNNRVDKNVRCN